MSSMFPAGNGRVKTRPYKYNTYNSIIRIFKRIFFSLREICT